MDKKPSVFPSKDGPSKEQITPKIGEEISVANNVYDKAKMEQQWDSIEQMKKRTEAQLRARNESLQNKTNKDEAADYKPFSPPVSLVNTMDQPEIKQTEPKEKERSSQELERIKELSYPDYNSPFDLIPVPTDCKLYKGHGRNKTTLKVAYLTTMDEDILTSPNLLNSGEFLNILINRKLLEPNIRYNDLHPSDRNAIMIWLRATGYGEMYPITLLDELDNAFETEFDLNTLKYKKLGAEPDDDGLFDFKLKVSGDQIKFKLLTVGDVEEIEEQIKIEKEKGNIISSKNTYMLQKHIVSVNGTQDRNFINEYVKKMRLHDASSLRKYIDEIDCSVDLNITVRTPGGGSITTFLPLTPKFFWPNI